MYLESDSSFEVKRSVSFNGAQKIRRKSLFGSVEYFGCPAWG
jgi:hypothetical protein